MVYNTVWCRPLWFWWYILLATLTSLKVPASGLSNLRVHVPDTVQRGQTAQFNCTFTLEDEKLYALKWYRGNYEIFRYAPGETPKIKTFPLEGYNVSMEHSTGYVLYLDDAKFVNTGVYSCEVIADTTFHTLIETKKMLVIDLPDKRPTIKNVNEKYEVGDAVAATCTSWNSQPAANLSWFINGEPAREAYLRKYRLMENFDGTITSALGLQFKVGRKHFANGEMVLKCTSSLLKVYWQSREVRIKESALKLSHSDGSISDPSSSTKKRKKKNEKDDGTKMPVEQLTSHVLSGSTSSVSKENSLLAVNQLVLLLLWNLNSKFLG